MPPTSAGVRVVATTALVCAGAGVAYLVVTTPPLRRMVGKAVWSGLRAGVTTYLGIELRDAWERSARSERRSTGSPEPGRSMGAATPPSARPG